MVKINVLLRKIESINLHLAKVNSYNKLSFKAFIETKDAQDIVTFNIFQTINSLISMIEHIAVDEEYGLPESASHAAELLAKNKILSSKDVEIIRQMVGFRNIIAHQYADIDQRKVHAALLAVDKDVRRIIKKITLRFKL